MNKKERETLIMHSIFGLMAVGALGAGILMGKIENRVEELSKLAKDYGVSLFQVMEIQKILDENPYLMMEKNSINSKFKGGDVSLYQCLAGDELVGGTFWAGMMDDNGNTIDNFTMGISKTGCDPRNVAANGATSLNVGVIQGGQFFDCGLIADMVEVDGAAWLDCDPLRSFKRQF